MSAYFVTSTGTGVGKTLVTCVLAHQLKQQGRKVLALKPVLSGYEEGVESDAHALLDSLEIAATPEAIDAVAPWRFAAPISPDMAARREGRAIDIPTLLEFCRARESRADVTLIEGVGGAFVPLGNAYLTADWIAELGCPAVLVVGSYLGTLSHTFATVEALRARGVPIASVIVSESAENPVPLPETAAAMKRWLKGVSVLSLPRLPAAFRSWLYAPDLTEALG